MGKSSVIPKLVETKFRVSFSGLFLILFITFSFVIQGCSKRAPKNLLNGDHAGAMNATLITDADSNGVIEPVVEISIPRSVLVFKEQGTGIEAGLVVSVSALSGGKLVGGGVATKRTIACDWAATKVDSMMTVRVPLQISSTTDAILEIKARSLYSSRFWNRRLFYSSGPWKQLPVTLLELKYSVGSNIISELSTDTLNVSILVQETAPMVDNSLDGLVGQWWVAMEISSKGTDFTVRRVQSMQRGQSINPMLVFFSIALDDLPFGDLLITPLLLAEKDSPSNSSPWQNKHLWTNLDVFFDGDGWLDQMQWLEGKVADSALSQLKNGPEEERKMRWNRFWSENTYLHTLSGQKHTQEEHLLLIVEANKRFTRGKPGAETARGKALIRFGIPHLIDDVGDETGRDERWETWTYEDSELTLIFHDPHGLGDYMLVETTIRSQTTP